MAVVRSTGLSGVVRTATEPTEPTEPVQDRADADPAPADGCYTGPGRSAPSGAGNGGASYHRAGGRLQVVAGTVTGTAAGTNGGSIAGGLGAPDRLLPVIRQLAPLLPGGGLRRGTTVATSGATSLVIGLLAAASRAGSWCAVVGLPTLGAAAAAEAGIALERLALVPYPGPEWGTVVASLLDGVDLVVTVPPGPISAGLGARLAARARQRGSVLIGYGRWPGADVTIDSTRSRWEGLDQGQGRLRKREMTVTSRGRGAAARPREATFWMPTYAPVNEGWSAAGWRARNEVNRPPLALLPTLEEPPPAGAVEPAEGVERAVEEAVS